jgi:hypothetical protein
MPASVSPLKNGIANSPIILSQSGVPVGIPSSGSIGNNGALTLTTALPTTYASIYLYFPANAISSGSAAGLYYCGMSSTTVGTIYNNQYTGGDVTVPANPTAFVTTGPGAYTQSTSGVTCISITVPGGLMGPRGRLRITEKATYPSNANAKNFQALFGGTNASFLGMTSATTNLRQQIEIENRGVQNSQVSSNWLSISAGASAFLYLAKDTSVDQVIALVAQLAVATDFAIYESYSVEALPS